MGRRYVERIQKHLDVRDEGFSIDADNQSFPPSFSGIQNGIIVCAMNQREWKAHQGLPHRRFQRHHDIKQQVDRKV